MPAPRALRCLRPAQSTVNWGGNSNSDMGSPNQTSSRGSEYGFSISEYSVRVDSFDCRGPDLIHFLLSVSHGHASWPIRRRFSQFDQLHQAIQPFLEPSARVLLRLPPKIGMRWFFLGADDRVWLERRKRALQRYLREVLLLLPDPEACPPLQAFLCAADVDLMTYGALQRLEEALDGTHEPNEPAVGSFLVSQLPQRVVQHASFLSEPEDFEVCVVCQEPMTPEDDIRSLACGHDYHHECIRVWLREKNSCCLCNAVAISEEKGEDASDTASTVAGMSAASSWPESLVSLGESSSIPERMSELGDLNDPQLPEQEEEEVSTMIFGTHQRRLVRSVRQLESLAEFALSDAEDSD